MGERSVKDKCGGSSRRGPLTPDAGYSPVEGKGKGDLGGESLGAAQR